MHWNDLTELRGPRVHPAVSIVAPLDRRRPGNPVDPRRLRALANEARHRLSSDGSGPVGDEVIGRLDRALAAVDLEHPADGVMIFVAPGETHVVPVDFPVREQVVIDRSFATRELVRGISRSVPYRVLVLGESGTRLLVGDGGRLVEPDGTGFPLACAGADDEPLESGGFATHTDRPPGVRLAHWREVGRRLAAVDASDPRPLVVVGPTRDIAEFDRTAAHRAAIVGEVVGDHHADPVQRIEELARPALADHLDRWRSVLVAELGESVGTGRAVSGVDATWVAAVEGRIDTLVVDRDAACPSRMVGGRPEPAPDPVAPDVVDAVDELIGVVGDRGGSTVVVDPGGLGSLGPVAARLRY